MVYLNLKSINDRDHHKKRVQAQSVKPAHNKVTETSSTNKKENGSTKENIQQKASRSKNHCTQWCKNHEDRKWDTKKESGLRNLLISCSKSKYKYESDYVDKWSGFLIFRKLP